MESRTARAGLGGFSEVDEPGSRTFVDVGSIMLVLWAVTAVLTSWFLVHDAVVDYRIVTGRGSRSLPDPVAVLTFFFFPGGLFFLVTGLLVLLAGPARRRLGVLTVLVGATVLQVVAYVVRPGIAGPEVGSYLVPAVLCSLAVGIAPVVGAAATAWMVRR